MGTTSEESRGAFDPSCVLFGKTRRRVRDLLAVVERDLVDSAAEELSAD
jgi:hypothetical protein